MKTTLLFAILLTAFSIAAQTQIAYSQSSMYLVGSDDFPEYKIEIKTCSTEKQITLSNGKKVPALNCFLIDKSEYVGGKLVNGKKSTEIIDIVMEASGEDGAKFIVKGKSFSMSFTLINGMILRLEENEAIFHTKGEGVWIISKKA